MPRVNLTLEDDLFKLISNQAKTHNLNVNNEIITILENIFFNEPFDFSSALNTLIEETATLPNGKEFLLNELPSFQTISMGKINPETSHYKPNAIRPRLGKLFNEAVRNNYVPNVSRALNEEGKLKSRGNTSIYLMAIRN